MKTPKSRNALRKAAKGILEGLGEHEEGEDPHIPEPKDDDLAGENVNPDDPDSLKDTAAFEFGPLKGAQDSGDGKKFYTDGKNKKHKQDSAMALLAANLGQKFNKTP